jgi:long-chain acyl-CoA synthetase
MNKPWLNNYPINVADEVTLNGTNSLIDIFHETVVRYKDSVAFSNFDVTLTFSDIDQKSRDFAAYLQKELGVKKGERIALMCPNILAFPIAMWGIIRTGAVQVNVNPSYTARELKHQLHNAQIDTIVIFSASMPILDGIIDDTSIKNIVIVKSDDAVNNQEKFSNVENNLVKTTLFEVALSLGHHLSFSEPDLQTDDLLFLQYTGGTTGLSKGAMLTHGNLIANIFQYKEFAKNQIHMGNETVLTVLPMYHIFALMANALCYFFCGAKNILVTDPRDISHLVELWQNHEITFFTGVNTLFNSLLNAPDFDKTNFSSLKLTIGGGAAVQHSVANKWEEVTGCRLNEGYGLSETSPILTLNFGCEKGYFNGIGTPLPSTEVSIRNDLGEEVSQGNSGELCAKGPQIMAGYWQDLKATSECMTEDGYLKTGDIAMLDQHGFFHIVDRKKDMIIVSGFNVYPNEIENEISKMQGVLESACIGVEDDKTGEAVKLFIVKNSQSITESDVISFCRQQLVAYKVPKHISFIEALPKSSVGKILRRSLK